MLWSPFSCLLAASRHRSGSLSVFGRPWPPRSYGKAREKFRRTQDKSRCREFLGGLLLGFVEVFGLAFGHGFHFALRWGGMFFEVASGAYVKGPHPLPPAQNNRVRYELL